MKKQVILACIMACVLLFVAGCSSEKAATGSIETDATNVTEKKGESNPKNDLDLGLKNVKIDNVTRNLTDSQKAVLQYFDNDYFTFYGSDGLKRYPQIYENSQVCTTGIVKKVISTNNDEFEMLLWLVTPEGWFYYRSDRTEEDYKKYLEENKNQLIIVKGKQTERRFIENDYVEVRGKFISVDSKEIDGVSYNLPTVNCYQMIPRSDFGEEEIARFDTSFIKTVAKSIFGDDVQIRNPRQGTDYQHIAGGGEPNFLICELDNQTNAKFTKYRFYKDEGLIEDGLTVAPKDVGSAEDIIRRELEFAPDFKHYFLFIYDSELKSLTLEYYDNQLNKVWKREFEQTQNAIYDYTENNIYLIANNDLYVINTSTGEDTFKPSYVGEKYGIRKLQDGILMISEGPADAIMKTDIEGNILWKTNTDEAFSVSTNIQLIDDRIILGGMSLNNADGKIIAQ